MRKGHVSGALSATTVLWRSMGSLVHDWIMATEPEIDIEWVDVAIKLAPARNYWLGTTTSAGAPHAAPVWGVVVDDQFYVYSERRTAKARNLALDPRTVVHLESGEHVVIVHGRMIDAGRPMHMPYVVDAFRVKYNDPGDDQYLPSSDEAFDVLYLLQPERALVWELSDFDGSQRRWSSSP
jgi:Pyridoxamine 5'-phosphate oxidase